MIGQIISHYRILSKLGEGGMGVVYEAEDLKLKRTVALKFLSPESTRDPAAKTRFIHEAQAASALDHPNICTIHEVEETGDGQLFIVMACYRGETLKERIARGPVSLDEAIDITSQVATGLAGAHQQDIVHRDIKPANIFITNEGLVKIVDFGLAKLAGQTRLTRTGSTLGTIAYMSPEQVQGEEVDQRSDLFSLGALMYELLSGEQPFKGEHEAALLYGIVHEEPKPVAAYRPELSPSIKRIVDRALVKKRETRYASATEFLDDLKNVQMDLKSVEVHKPESEPLIHRIRQPRLAVPCIVLVLALVAALNWWLNRRAKVRWAREDALPEIERLAQDVPWTGEGPQTWAAFELAMESTKYIPDDPLLARLWPQFSWYLKVQSEPIGVNVYAKPYADVTSHWRYFGQTPIDSVRFPSGYSRMKLEKDGYRTRYDVAWVLAYFSGTVQRDYVLAKAGTLPEEMELIPGVLHRLRLPGLDHLEKKWIHDFLLDRHEVSNAAYKRFVDAGGYTKPEYWKHPFVWEGRILNWEEARTHFTDKTGRPGPATWEIGDYPEGKGDHPVSGVSWYEAAAYAEFIGKKLPTIYHWNYASMTAASPEIVPRSNLGGSGTVPVGSSRSMNRYGVHDMAGNVREWCLNKFGRGEDRFILGGGWDDPAYSFVDAYAQHPFNRYPTNGFRCVRYMEDEEGQTELEDTVGIPVRDFLNEPRVSEETFATFLSQFAYDRTDLDAVVEYVREEKDWVREKVTFNAAYGNERMIAYLFLPKQGTPPYQTVIFFPGSTAIYFRSSESNAIPFLTTLGSSSRGFLTKSGRAVLYPICKSTFERGDDLKSDVPDESHFYKEHLIMWVKDLCRSVDYLETREDIDTSKIAYFGYSWGSTLLPVMAAAEKRLKAGVLLVGGLYCQKSLPEVDQVHYLPRMTIPVLMLNGKYDFFFPYETSQIPFFELIGTRKENKKLLAYEMSHIVPRVDLIKETLDWLDFYLGRVE